MKAPVAKPMFTAIVGAAAVVAVPIAGGSALSAQTTPEARPSFPSGSRVPAFEEPITTQLPSDGAPRTAVGIPGRRYQTRNTVFYSDPTGRLTTRIPNRVQSRLRTRIDPSYDPSATVASPFEEAEDSRRRTGATGPR